MSGVSVVIPWGGPGVHDPWRQEALAWVCAQLARHAPKWQVVLGQVPPDAPWSKGRAVWDALDQCTGDTLVIHDADSWSGGTSKAALWATQGRWAMPHNTVRRLSPEATRRLYDEGERTDVRLLQLAAAEQEKTAYSGGGIVAIPRAMYEACPLDPRFEGWGGEDESWARALTLLHGARRTAGLRLVHLYHEPQDRPARDTMWEANEALRRRYYHHKGDRVGMAALVGEALDALAAPDSTSNEGRATI